MWIDKFQSKKKGSRIPENYLVLLACILGAIGIYAGMKAPIYHKASKIKFKYGIPILVLINGTLIYYIFKNV
jgi:uncharacterized membrane protein YsdA (DUF1294 family)